ncbi:MAG: peroxiredoxin [Pararhodobacter sp.]|nr:peroxiredoxin [Pararhodobacter sp.]
MTITVGNRLPEATLVRMGENGPEQLSISGLTAGRKVVIFAVPGAFSATCHMAHVPSFIRTHDALKARGVDEIICISVNDPFVMKAWAEATGADKAGITMLADADGSFTRALGMQFDIPAVGLIGRSKRYAMLAEDGVVKVFNLETARGTCEMSGGEAMLDTLEGSGENAA